MAKTVQRELRNLRREYGLSERSLAEIMGIDRGALRNKEYYCETISLSHFLDTCAALEANPINLLKRMEFEDEYPIKKD